MIVSNVKILVMLIMLLLLLLLLNLYRGHVQKTDLQGSKQTKIDPKRLHYKNNGKDGTMATFKTLQSRKFGHDGLEVTLPMARVLSQRTHAQFRLLLDHRNKSMLHKQNTLFAGAFWQKRTQPIASRELPRKSFL